MACGRKLGSVDLFPELHSELVKKAKQWLRGTKRCYPVFSESTSCRESPDAIGWNSRGSIVVECKTSVIDFRRDRNKYVGFRNPRDGYIHRSGRGWNTKKFQELGWERVDVTRMGTRRYILCPFGLINEEDLQEYAPDHGLLFSRGKQILVMVEASKRTTADLESEVRLLRLHWGSRNNDSEPVGEQRFDLPEEQPDSVEENQLILENLFKDIAR
jgi:hypothetical protein